MPDFLSTGHHDPPNSHGKICLLDRSGFAVSPKINPGRPDGALEDIRFLFQIERGGQIREAYGADVLFLQTVKRFITRYFRLPDSYFCKILL
jgi:hypothetical protein